MSVYKSKWKISKTAYIYRGKLLFEFTDTQLSKISKNIYCLCSYKGTILQEKELHKIFIKDRVRDNGEWFYPSKK